MNINTTWRSFFIVGLFFMLVTVTSCNQEIKEFDEKNIPVITEKQQCFAAITGKENEDSLHIVGLGDSLTVGVGDEKNEGGYIGKLTKKLSKQDCPIRLVNYGVEGDKTTDLLENLQNDDVRKAIEEAHVIMFTIGANDLVAIARKERMQFSEKTLAKAEQQYSQQIEKILQKLKSLNEDAHIYVIGFYNPISTAIINNEQIDLLVTKWNNMSKLHTSKHEDTFFIRIDDLFSEEMHRYLAEDNFHPNHLGYEKIAERLIQIIQARSE